MAETNVVRPALFRAESLRARQLEWQGRPALAVGFPTVFTTFASVALAAAIGALITFGSYARRVDMGGAVLPNTGVIAISTPSPGRIERLAVTEGEAVKKNALLYTVDVDTAIKGGGTQQQIIQSQHAERQMLTQQIDRKTRMNAEGEKELRQKIETLKAQLNQVGGQITMQQNLVMKVSKDYMTFADLARRHVVAVDELNPRQQAWMEAVSRLQDLESSQLRLQEELKDAQSQLTTTIQTRSDEIDALKNRILEIDEQLANNEAHHSIEIRAPVDGVITAIIGEPGQTVGPGMSLLTIVPRHAPMQADLLATSRAIGFIHQGERVRLRYSAFPYQKYGEYWGTVVTVSRAPLSAEEVRDLLAGVPPTEQNSPLYRIIVKPDNQRISIDGKEHALPAGMQVQASALLDRRPLYQWILEPLYDVGRAVHGS